MSRRRQTLEGLALFAPSCSVSLRSRGRRCESVGVGSEDVWRSKHSREDSRFPESGFPESPGTGKEASPNRLAPVKAPDPAGTREGQNRLAPDPPAPDPQGVAGVLC